MPFGHVYVAADQPEVAEALDRHLEEDGLHRFDMIPERHPARMKEISEQSIRLFWLSPRLSGWTGLFEFSYYDNHTRQRWGFADERLAARLSARLKVPVYRLEVLDNAGFWLYNRFEGGIEAEGGAYEDIPGPRSTDPGHPRYRLNRIIEREGFSNLGVMYEHIPGPMVRPVEKIGQSPRGIEGHGRFLHRAYEKRPG